MSPATRIAFIGGGNMARSLIGGLLKAGWAGRALAVSEPAGDARAALQRQFGGRGVTCLADNAAAVEFAAAVDDTVTADATVTDDATVTTDSTAAAPARKTAGVAVRGATADATVNSVLVLAVKPQSMRAALASAAAAIQHHKPLLISIAAGIRAADVARWAGDGAAAGDGAGDGAGDLSRHPRSRLSGGGAGDAAAALAIVRAMPNTPALVNAGVAGLFANAVVTPPQRALAESILRAVGEALWVDDEALIDAVTGISGSGPAYLFKWMELLAAAAEAHGIAADDARRLVAQTALGAALLAKSNGASPAELRRQVTSKGGATEAALNAMEAGGIDAAMRRGIDAAIHRSSQIADEFGGESHGECQRESRAESHREPHRESRAESAGESNPTGVA